MTLLITGGAGFIGGHFTRHWLQHASTPVVVLDALTYAANRAALSAYDANPRFTFVHGEIGDAALIDALLHQYRPRAIVHFAAETHVDRSIDTPAAFIHTNITGTFTLLERTLRYWETIAASEQQPFRFLHVSTDEVYGSLSPTAPGFTETAPYQPNNPYAASKAASDHLVRAWHHTYGLPTLTSHGTNTYGPYQFPEKLIPRMIACALAGQPIPIYGDGQHIRDWLYVEDHCAALNTILAHGRVGETYAIGSNTERTNLELATAVCSVLDRLAPAPQPYHHLIRFVPDRLGHDRRYALNPTKLRTELGFAPHETLETGLEKTVRWYVAQRNTAIT